jgi:trehalose-phosphatase
MSRQLFEEMWGIGERIAKAPHLLICLDYDGTLAPFEENPGQVYLSPQMQRLLRSLAGHEGTTVAVISGRERVDLQTRIGIPDVIYAGNHGLEISGPGLIFIEPTAMQFQKSLQELAAALAPSLKTFAGASVEDKGLTVTVHYRKVAETRHEDVRRVVQDALKKIDHPLLLTTGDRVFEIRPPVAWHKGIAVRWIKEKLGLADALPVYVGDDLTDEDAFNSLPEGITIKVGGAPRTAATYQIENQEEVRRFLEWVDNMLHQRPVRVGVTDGP